MFMKIQKEKKGVAGLDIYLSVIAMIFVIGIIIMAFVLVGTEMMDSTTDQSAIDVINATTLSIASASDWFGIFIVISAVVVLILLIVMIVISLRQGGLMGGQGGA